MAALSGLIPLAHGGAVGLATEIGAAVALAVLMVWALWKSRRARDDREENRPR